MSAHRTVPFACGNTFMQSFVNILVQGVVYYIGCRAFARPLSCSDYHAVFEMCSCPIFSQNLFEIQHFFRYLIG